MAKKKTVFVWVLIAFLAWSVGNSIGSVLKYPKIFKNLWGNNPALYTLDLIFLIISIILTLILLVKLSNVSKDVQKWVHLTFGFLVASSILTGLLKILGNSSKIFSVLISLLVPIFMWIGITMHLNRAKREKLMDFS